MCTTQDICIWIWDINQNGWREDGNTGDVIGQVHNSERRGAAEKRCKRGNRKRGAECLLKQVKNFNAEQERKVEGEDEEAREAQSAGFFNDSNDIQGRGEGTGCDKEQSGPQGTEPVDKHGGRPGREQAMGQARRLREENLEDGGTN